MSAPAIAEEAQEALRLAEAEPERAAALSADIVKRALATLDLAAAAVAERAWGRALRHGGDVDNAITHLREAVRLAQKADSAELAAEARVTLSGALVEHGQPQKALDEIGAALRILDGVDRARALSQRGTILLALGRYGEAIADYRAALPALREAGHLLGLYRLTWNRGLAHTYRFEFGPAEADLREAERLARELDLPVQVGYAQANLAFVLGARGDVPAALDYFDKAERRIRAHGAQVGSLLQDRSELLLSVRLVAEARHTAEQAIIELQRERRDLKLPEVRLLLAQAAFLDEDLAASLEHARRAVREFNRLQRPEWAALARLAVLRAECAGERRSRVGVARIEKLVTELADAGWRTASVEARLLAARLLLERGRGARARRHLREAALGRGPATLQARAWYAKALHRLSLDDRRGAAGAIRAGLRVLDRHGAALGASDLRAHVAGHRTDLIEAGLGMALDDGRPARVFEWAERGRASQLLGRPLRPPRDPELADALVELRATVAEINASDPASRSGGRVAALLHRQVTLERQIRDHTWRRRGDAAARPYQPVRIDALAGALAGTAFLEFVQLDGILHGISVVDGRARLRRLGSVSEVDGLLDRIPFALHRLIRADLDPASEAAAGRLLRFAAGRLDELLLRPFAEIGDRPLVVVPTGPLQCMAWSVLPSCAGRALTVSPSATMWYSASLASSGAAAHVAVAAGPTLPGAREEAQAVAEIHGTDPLLHPAATVDAVMSALNGAGVAHLATHGRLSAHNPLFSDLMMSDGPLLVYDLEGLHRVPHTVVLAACDSARSVVCAGDELLGLSATFLAQGATQLVASVLPILDAATAPVMVAFHRLLAAGQAPAPALAAAQREMTDDRSTMAAAAGFVCIGAGFAAPSFA